MSLITGTTDNDVLYGDASADTIQGLAGDDYIEGGGGADLLEGGDGRDIIFTQGAATVSGGGGGDVIAWYYGQGLQISGGAGRDIFRIDGLQSGDSTVITDFVAGSSGDSIDLGIATVLGANPFGNGYLRLVQSGADTLIQYDADGTQTNESFVTVVTLQNVTASQIVAQNLFGYDPAGGVASMPNIVGTAADDEIWGTHGSESIRGLDGNDRIYAGDGDDTILGGDGADTIVDISMFFPAATGGHDVYYGGGGNDLLAVQASISVQPSSTEFFGGNGDDTIIAATYWSVAISGGAGDDLIRYTAIYEQMGLVTGDDGADTIDGSGEGDYGMDLRGGAGADLIIGGYWNDTLVGGGGGDTFRFIAYSASDVVTDFGSGDVVDLSGWIDASLTYSVATSGADAVITASSGDAITLTGAAGHLSATATGFAYV